MHPSPDKAEQIAGHMTPTGSHEPEGPDNMRVSAVLTGPDRLVATCVSALAFLQTASDERRFWGVDRFHGDRSQVRLRRDDARLSQDEALRPRIAQRELGQAEILLEPGADLGTDVAIGESRSPFKDQLGLWCQQPRPPHRRYMGRP